eukprot:4449566-Pleurochrysis_carterae.AAC.1
MNSGSGRVSKPIESESPSTLRSLTLALLLQAAVTVFPVESFRTEVSPQRKSADTRGVCNMSSSDDSDGLSDLLSANITSFASKEPTA